MLLSRKHPQVSRAAAVACQPLESRLLFVGFTIDGTSGPDAISLGINGNDILFVVNGVSDTRSDIIFNEVTINALGGNDTISIIETGANTVTVSGGSGNDTINLGNGGGDLDPIDDFVTVNGDGDSDTVVLHDQNETTAVDFDFFNGNQVTRTGVPTMTLNVESVVVHGGPASNDFSMIDPPTPTLTLNGNAHSGTTDLLRIDGSPGQSATYTPSATTQNSGTVVFQGRTINFTTTERVHFNVLPNTTFVTPNADDDLRISGTHVLAGTSGGVGFAPPQFFSCGVLNIDMAANDGGAGNDSLLIEDVITQVTRIGVNAGTGSNLLDVRGTVAVDTDLGALSGQNLTVLVHGSAANLSFDGFQNIKRLEINNNATAQFIGTGTVMNTRELAVTAGEGNIRVGTGQTAVCTLNGSFALGAGRTLNKEGVGTLNINAAQSHGSGSFFNVNNGTANFNTNAGSTSSRPLTVFADGATLNLNTTQHLNIVSTGVGGVINLTANGNRVLVCNQIFIESEGSQINLADNDMILDYSGASQVEVIRQHITNGYANGAWAGIGIVSNSAAAAPNNTALGYADATDLFTTFPATFSGQQVDSTAVLVKYTYNGDSNLNGNVNLDDFNRLAANFGTANKRWIHGDSDYNLSINLVDFNKLAATFGLSGLAPESSGSTFWGEKTIADEIFAEV